MDNEREGDVGRGATGRKLLLVLFPFLLLLLFLVLDALIRGN